MNGTTHQMDYVDVDEKVLYLVTWGIEGRVFYTPALNDKHAIEKAKSALEFYYHIPEPLLSILMNTVTVERTELEWPT